MKRVKTGKKPRHSGVDAGRRPGTNPGRWAWLMGGAGKWEGFKYDPPDEKYMPRDQKVIMSNRRKY